MGTWLGMNGRTYHEVQVHIGDSEANARAWCESQGASLRREKMQGSFYQSDTRQFRIERSSWSDGFVVYESKAR